MARQSKADYLKRCKARVHGAQSWRKDEKYDSLWERMIELYSGKQFPKTLTTEDRISVNIAFSTINVIGPSVAVNHPTITVNARRPEDDDKAVVTQALLSYWWRHYDCQPQFRLAVKDFLITGHGWVKTGYRFVEETKKRHPDDYAAEVSSALDQADQFAAENPDMANLLPSEEDIHASVADTEMHVAEDRPFVERINPFDMFVDPEANTLDDAAWIAQRVVKCLDDVRKDDRYKVSARRSVKADLRADKKTWGDRGERDQDVQRVTVWEFYDLKAGTMCVFAENGDDLLVDPIDQPYAFGHPFVMLRNYEVPNRLYPMGELEAIEDLQGELNKTRSQQMNDRKRYKRKYLYKKGAFDRKAAGILESDVDGAMVPVNDQFQLAEVVVPLPITPLDPQIYMASEQIEADVNLVTGVSEYARGQTPDIRRTATEVAATSDAANSRAADKLVLIEDAISQIARRLIMLAQQYMTEPQVARIVGNNGEPVWTAVEPEWIRGEFDFEVEAGSTQPTNEMQKRQSAMGIMQTLAPLAAPGGPINVTELVSYVLKTGFGIKDPSKFINPPAEAAPPPPPSALAGGPMPGGPHEQDPSAQQAPPQGADQGQMGGQSGGIPPELLAQLQGQMGLG